MRRRHTARRLRVSAAPAGARAGRARAVRDGMLARLTGWRRIANAMWHPPDDPQIFGARPVNLEVKLT